MYIVSEQMFESKLRVWLSSRTPTLTDDRLDKKIAVIKNRLTGSGLVFATCVPEVDVRAKISLDKRFGGYAVDDLVELLTWHPERIA